MGLFTRIRFFLRKQKHRQAIRSWIRHLQDIAQKAPDDRGVGCVECFLIGVILALLFIYYGPVHADAAELERMRFTCYCPESCPGTVTASGQTVREGIIASSRDHMGDGAMIYLNDGTFLGFYECLDTGSGAGLRNGTAIDVWTPNLQKAKELMRLTEGEVMVTWIKDPKG